MDRLINILGFAGSLRSGSYNRALLRASSLLLPPECKMEIFELNEIPPFNQDKENNPPDSVKEFKRLIRASDCLIIATPEYNYGVPGVLKNAIDWASRPYGDNAFAHKSVALMSASTGILGGARAQYQLRQSFVFLEMHPTNLPECFVTFAPQKFDSNGNLTDQKTKEVITNLIAGLVDWTRRLKAAESYA
jgi:chromate reductase, NAD(P)H dehydrogenase (quinone)